MIFNLSTNQPKDMQVHTGLARIRSDPRNKTLLFVLTEDDDEDEEEDEAAEEKPAGEAASAVESTLEGAKVLNNETWLLHPPLSQETAIVCPKAIQTLSPDKQPATFNFTRDACCQQ